MPLALEAVAAALQVQHSQSAPGETRACTGLSGGAMH